MHVLFQQEKFKELIDVTKGVCLSLRNLIKQNESKQIRRILEDNQVEFKQMPKPFFEEF